jgi:hypothetical protein
MPRDVNGLLRLKKECSVYAGNQTWEKGGTGGGQTEFVVKRSFFESCQSSKIVRFLTRLLRYAIVI